MSAVEICLAAALVVSAQAAGTAQDEKPFLEKADHVTFLASFDTSLNADFALGDAKARVKDATLAGPGKGLAGDGAQVGQGAYLAYAASGNLPADNGSLELWFRTAWDSTPDNQSAGDGQRYHQILNFVGKGWSRISVNYDDFWNVLAIRTAPAQAGRKTQGANIPLAVKAGDWHYLVITWENLANPSGKQRIQTYLDGKPPVTMEAEDFGFALDEKSFICVGCVLEGDGSPSARDAKESFNGVIDELAISRNVKTVQEISKAWQRGTALGRK